MKIVFLGTGSGWGVMIRQERATGGIWLEMRGKPDRIRGRETQIQNNHEKTDNCENIIIDPGPGFLRRCMEEKIDPSKLSAVLLSHAHTDHVTEANVAIEAMVLKNKEKHGTVLAGHNVLEGDEKYTPVVSEFHKDLPERVLEMASGSEANIGELKIYGTKTEHYEPKCVGFMIEGEKRIGYTADGAYYPGMGNQFPDCDILIVNNFLPLGNLMPGHMNTDGTILLASEAKPKKIIITHFSEHILEIGPSHEAALIEKMTGIPTLAAEDGMIIE